VTTTSPRIASHAAVAFGQPRHEPKPGSGQRTV